MGKPGRPKGATFATSLKKKFQDYFTPEEVQGLIDSLKIAMVRDSKIKLFVVEQLFGKAPQRIEMTGNDGQPILIQISEEIAKKNNVLNKSSS